MAWLDCDSAFLVAQPSIICELHKVRDSYNCDALSIAGATAAIDDQEWLSENRSKVIATRERLQQEMASLGFSVQPSQANFVWCTHADRPLQTDLRIPQGQPYSSTLHGLPRLV